MKKSLVLAMAMALGVTASAYAANPFSDVPAGHWAYDSVSKLAAAGVIEGYGDTTFGGDKLMTRYEMAQIVAKAMAKGANVDKLAAEFADELQNLGVRVAKLEKKADNVKITGTIKMYQGSFHATGYGPKSSNSRSRLRSDITMKGAINEDWTYTALLRNEQEFGKGYKNAGEETANFQRAYVNGKIGGLKVQAGRYNWTNVGDGILGGDVWDNRVDGVAVEYGKAIKVNGAYMQAAAPKDTKLVGMDADHSSYIYNAGITAKLGKAADLRVQYYKFTDLFATAGSDEIWQAGFNAKLGKSLVLGADYYHSDYDDNDADKDGFTVGLKYKGASAAKAGSWGLAVKYYDMPVGVAIAPGLTYQTNLPYSEATTGAKMYDGMKGFGASASYAFAKGIVGNVYYYSLEGQTDFENKHAETLGAELVFSF